MLKVNLLNKSGIQKKDTKDISIIFKEKSINNNHIDKIENQGNNSKIHLNRILLASIMFIITVVFYYLMYL